MNEMQLINKKDVLRALCAAVHKEDELIPCENQVCSCLWAKTRVCDFFNEINKIVPFQPERKKGKWVEHHEPFTWMGYTYWTCSECNFGEKEENKTRSNFCPHCGAEMVKNSDG